MNRRTLLVLATALVLALLAASTATAGEAEDVATGCEAVHVGPVIPPGSPPASYFTLRLAAGETAQPALLVANPEPYSCQVEVQPAYGQTAVNSGDTYPVTGRAPDACAQTSCWLSGLPAHVTLAAHARLQLHFAVHVPTGTPPGDYLAGVVAEPGGSRPALTLHSSQAGAILIARVGLGVAVVVPGPLSPQLRITAVRLAGTRTGVLSVSVSNHGNTWEHPAGHAIVEVGKTKRTFRLAAATILPGNHATLPLAVAGIRQGAWPTEVELWYDHRRKVATWLGSVGYTDVPSAAHARLAHPAAARTGYRMPTWSTILIGTLAGFSLALVFVVLLLLPERRRRRRRREGIVLHAVGPSGKAT